MKTSFSKRSSIGDDPTGLFFSCVVSGNMSNVHSCRKCVTLHNSLISYTSCQEVEGVNMLEVSELTRIGHC